MASKSGVKVVRLKHNQLLGLSEQYKDVSEKERKDAASDEKNRRSKRPDQVLYRPGMHRQIKKAGDSPTAEEKLLVDVSPSVETVSGKLSECNIKERTSIEREQTRPRAKKSEAASYESRPKSGRTSTEAEASPSEIRPRGRQKSEEKSKPKEERKGTRGGRSGKGARNPKVSKVAKDTKPSRESNDSFESTENGLEWDYQLDINSSRHQLEDEFVVDADLALRGGALLPSSPQHKEASRPLRDPSPDDSQSFQPGHFQGMVITNSRFDDDSSKKSNSSKARKSTGSSGKPRPEEEKRPRSRGSTDGNNSAKEAKNQHNMQSHHGGLLHLPAGTSLTQNSSQPMAMPARGRGRPSRGRGSHRTLYDPNNPQKHQNTQPLSFHDDHTGSPDSPYSPQGMQQGHPRFPQDHWYPQQEYTMTGSPQAHAEGHKIHHQEGGHLPDDTYTRDPYYHSGYEQEAPSSSGRLSKAESILRDVAPRDSQLCNVISRRIAGADGFARMMSLRKEVQDLYSQVVLLDPDLCNHRNVEQLLWKNAFYQIIELLRHQLDDDAEDGPPVKQSLLQLIDDGTAFYQKLLADLQNVYKFNLEDFLDQTQMPSENLNRRVKLALLSAQRTLICLGDIARYKELANHTTNYGRSRSWYMKAQQIAPKNGRPYNQLAILALYTRRKLDAVYYYIRSLAASNPFLTARESLISLFDEARRKAETSEKKKKEEKAEHRNRRQMLKKQDAQYGTEHRLEVWHCPDGSTSLEGNSEEEEELSMIELNRKFILSYLNVQGKLFTKTGMESFLDARHQMLQELVRLLSFSPIPVGNTRLLQLMAINMFAVDNATPKEGSVESGCRALLQEQAVQLGLDMFACLMNRSIQLFHQHQKSGSCQILSDDLHQLIASIKVWADWMTCHDHMWNPPPTPVDPAFSLGLDVWESIAKMCNVLQDLQISHVKLYGTRREGCEAVILEEDVVMQGFVPLLTLPQSNTYVHSFTEKDVAKDCLRIIKLTTFGDYLCGIASPVLTYNVPTRSYESFVPTCADEGKKVHHRTRTASVEDDDDVLVESSSASEAEDSDEGAEHIRHLKKRKQELQRKMKEKDKYQKTIDAALKSNQRPLVIDVNPVNLVPDTNCFISHLEELQHILATSRYTLVVPLIVITELDGLAKGQRDCDHAHQLPGQASRAVAFLEAEFEARNSLCKAITSKGNFMTTISFRSEESAADKGNNDDIILSCCLHQIKDLARDFMPDKDQEGPITLKRDVVLLTDDRNLHLKAHMRNVPVRNVNNFMRWAKIS